MTERAGSDPVGGDDTSPEELEREFAYIRDQIHELIDLRDRRPLAGEERERYDALTRREKELIARRRLRAGGCDRRDSQPRES